MPITTVNVATRSRQAASPTSQDFSSIPASNSHSEVHPSIPQAFNSIPAANNSIPSAAPINAGVLTHASHLYRMPSRAARRLSTSTDEAIRKLLEDVLSHPYVESAQENAKFFLQVVKSMQDMKIYKTNEALIKGLADLNSQLSTGQCDKPESVRDRIISYLEFKAGKSDSLTASKYTTTRASVTAPPSPLNGPNSTTLNPPSNLSSDETEHPSSAANVAATPSKMCGGCVIF